MWQGAILKTLYLFYMKLEENIFYIAFDEIYKFVILSFFYIKIIVLDEIYNFLVLSFYLR